MERVKNFINEHNTLTLATSNGQKPAAAAVFYTYIKNDNLLLFVSSKKSEHIMNCKEQPNCAATIQEDGLEWSVIKGLQIKGEISLAEDKYWNDYFEKYPYIKTDKKLSAALEKVDLYKLEIKWVRLIDNSKGFGNREEYNF
ncbi:MAG: pyridoxamine 5'-phosphate oxidase [Euryarchaeota archaeon]|nr:pyridoxamine 5'-phosphate oxidase [Euryarchaeota archaeon]|tara:strand:- start:254 stop:679 length:426 start_codon:yes stop_codon:yes gene_type:complete